jgi:hypothetical protein
MFRGQRHVARYPWRALFASLVTLVASYVVIIAIADRNMGCEASPLATVPVTEENLLQIAPVLAKEVDSAMVNFRMTMTWRCGFLGLLMTT